MVNGTSCVGTEGLKKGGEGVNVNKSSQNKNRFLRRNLPGGFPRLGTSDSHDLLSLYRGSQGAKKGFVLVESKNRDGGEELLKKRGQREESGKY